MKYRSALLKTKLELIGMSPFVLMGRLYGKLFPLRPSGSLFLFFSSADIGGAPRVNADILECIKDRQPVIIFSKKPRNSGFRELFKKDGVRIFDLHQKIDNKLYHFVNFFYRGVLAAWIDQTTDAIVFGGECLFFYKVIPHLKKSVRRVELCHLPTWLPYSIGFIDRIDVRVCSTLKMKETIEGQYRENRVGRLYEERLLFIENKIDIPAPAETGNKSLEVVFIGRGAPQKRIHLITAMAADMHALGLPIHFSFVGDVEKSIDPTAFPFCSFFGNIQDEEKMKAIYRHSDVLILTSAYEGLPLVVMQMMAYGKVILSTAVNSIPDYIMDGVNGLLIRATDEPSIIREGVESLRALLDNPVLRITMGQHNRQIAIERFSGETFCKSYRRLLIR